MEARPLDRETKDQWRDRIIRDLRRPGLSTEKLSISSIAGNKRSKSDIDEPCRSCGDVLTPSCGRWSSCCGGMAVMNPTIPCPKGLIPMVEERS